LASDGAASRMVRTCVGRASGAHAMREVISGHQRSSGWSVPACGPSGSMQSAHNQHALSMQSACPQHAILVPACGPNGRASRQCAAQAPRRGAVRGMRCSRSTESISDRAPPIELAQPHSAAATAGEDACRALAPAGEDACMHQEDACQAHVHACIYSEAHACIRMPSSRTSR
jgi:hypothetical protein